jgi:hypothetical protein
VFGVALLLLAVFAAPFVGKPLHFLCDDVCPAHHDASVPNDGHHSNDDDCPVCQFTFSLFVEAETVIVNFIPLVRSFEQACFYASAFILPITGPCRRGPPTA